MDNVLIIGSAARYPLEYNIPITTLDRKYKTIHPLRVALFKKNFGLKNYSLEDIKGGSPQQNADIIKAILSGNGQEAHNAAVIINCAALLYLHDKAKDLKSAAQLASDVLKSGKGLATLELLVSLSDEKNANE